MFTASPNATDIPGVYAIWNTTKNKFYIGSCKNLKNRFASHKTALNQNRHASKKLQADFNNGDDFRFIGLTRVLDESNLRYYEKMAVDMFGAKYPLYNQQRICVGLAHEASSIKYSLDAIGELLDPDNYDEVKQNWTEWLEEDL